jgi:ribosome-associated translation inhibitor RaiA
MDIQWHVVTNLESSRKDWAEARIRKLSEGRKDLIHVVIHVEGSNHHQHGAAEAKIRCQAKGREVIAHERDEEPEIALTRAVEVFEREVRNMRSKRRSRRGGAPNFAAEETVGEDHDEDEVAQAAD